MGLFNIIYIVLICLIWDYTICCGAVQYSILISLGPVWSGTKLFAVGLCNKVFLLLRNLSDLRLQCLLWGWLIWDYTVCCGLYNVVYVSGICLIWDFTVCCGLCNIVFLLFWGLSDLGLHCLLWAVQYRILVSLGPVWSGTTLFAVGLCNIVFLFLWDLSDLGLHSLLWAVQYSILVSLRPVWSGTTLFAVGCAI